MGGWLEIGRIHITKGKKKRERRIAWSAGLIDTYRVVVSTHARPTPLVNGNRYRFT
jgi:hypothetical protein